MVGKRIEGGAGRTAGIRLGRDPGVRRISHSIKHRDGGGFKIELGALAAFNPAPSQSWAKEINVLCGEDNRFR